MTKAGIIKLVLAIAIGGGIGALMGYYGKCSSGTCPLTANPYRGAVYGALMGLLFGMSFISNASSKKAFPTENAATKKIDSLPALQECVLSSAETPLLLDLYSNSCPPCRKLAPIVEELASEYQGRAQVVRINIDEVSEVADKFNIKGIPTVIIFINGKEAERLVGAQRKAAYVKILDHYLEKSDGASVGNADL